ncbi:redoxin domain-containing protein [Cohnella ginsengisoli]|uniref:Redoxin domain-containing protein n=1 Tax=Cohnella ginsengisoli TaxID=425004 RepID=A0A9X4KDC4_9BACL|nr:redoxin domain-containing protein [Cohnella ginsengisoli]MDG0789706.1 redoxin domain-containing protein [Cohnella ginsengisoli]
MTPNKALKPGSEAPAFELLGLDGQAHSLESYRGKPLVINFWGTFCPPCRNEMPALQAQYDKWKDQGVQLVGINLSEDRVSVGSFLRSYDIHFPVLLDKNKKNGTQIRPEGVSDDFLHLGRRQDSGYRDRRPDERGDDRIPHRAAARQGLGL